MSFLTKIFGDANEKIIKQLEKKVDEINNFEKDFDKKSDEDLRKKVKSWQKELQGKDFDEQQKILDNNLAEAFAVVREAAKRTLSQRHYDVQLVSGMILHQGKIAEMKTGEGKTLSSTTAIFLNALTGRGVHVITVNDYLSRRDAVWMGQVFEMLGLSVSCINQKTSFIYDPAYKNQDDDKTRDEQGSFKVVEEYLKPVTRQEAYLADITYGTNNEFGFDYLRDNMVRNKEDKVQRELHFAIIDEVDSILIDEARTPLIISAPANESTDKYVQFMNIVANFKEEEDYTVDEKAKTVVLTEEGIIKTEKKLGVENIYTERGLKDVHHLEQSLKAKVLFQKNKDYIVQDNEVVIVDEFTGRLMHGRRYSDGLHQAIEAKEGVTIRQESVTMATVTFQNYFRMYQKLAGMTGTAVTEAEEFAKIYQLEVIVVPTNKPIVRQDKSDVIYKSKEEKYKAIVEDIKLKNNVGQPVLVGTISIENNEYLSKLLELEGVPHQVLNAKQHQQEGEVIAQAGRRGAVTIATNMAGRGVDVLLGGNPSTAEEQEDVKQLGGLHVIGTERHESRRIDNQLRGRSGRQGDVGSSQFFVSTEDDLMRIFGGDKIRSIMNTLGVPEGMPIENKMISGSLEKAQRKVEGQNFDIRKHLVEYDDVVNKHRETIYKRRDAILDQGQELHKMILADIKSEVADIVTKNTMSSDEESWSLNEIYENMGNIFSIDLESRIGLEDIKATAGDDADDKNAREKMTSYLYSLAEQEYKELEEKVGAVAEGLGDKIEDENFKQNPMRTIEKDLSLRVLDMLWVEHIDAIDRMRQSIGLRGYGQKDPLVEYKKEAHKMFNSLLAEIRKQIVYSIYKVGLASDTLETPEQNLDELNFSGAAKTSQEKVARNISATKITKLGATSVSVQTAPVTSEHTDKFADVGRNDPCPCGATKEDGTPVKFKHCHGK